MVPLTLDKADYENKGLDQLRIEFGVGMRLADPDLNLKTMQSITVNL